MTNLNKEIVSLTSSSRENYLVMHLWSLHFALSKKIEKMNLYQQF